MGQTRELLLNGILATLVASSILLSTHIWFPSEELPLIGTEEARVQMPPPDGLGQMPDVYRPERVYVGTGSGKAALLPADSEAYRAVWGTIQTILRGAQPDWTAAPEEEPQAERQSVVLVLPVSLPMREWAAVWNWDAGLLGGSDQRIDRIRLQLGPTGSIYLSGPLTSEFRLGPLSESQVLRLQELAAGLDPSLLLPYRPVTPPSVAVRLTPGLTAPDVQVVPWARVSARSPDPKWEESRYFPDLSVVREIDEKDARSFTDGQRLLRIRPSGVLEYRTAEAEGTAPDLARAQELARDWIGARGGWQSELVLAWHVQEGVRTTLSFEARQPGPFPVETAGGALQIQVAVDPANPMADRVISLRRFPDLLPAFDKKVSRPVIAPEAALAVAEKEFPRLMLFETVRELHLAYLVQPGSQPGDVGWQIEPAWVIQVGEDRIYVPGVTGSLLRPVQVGPTAN